MKRLLIALALLASPATSLVHAQARVIFVNDAASPVVLRPETANVNLLAALYAGTTSNYLTMQSPAVLVSGGNIPPTDVTLAGAVHYFQARVWDSAYASYEAALIAGSFVGEGEVFTMNVVPFPTVRTAPPSIYSTWHDGPIVASQPVQPPVMSNLQWTNGVFQFDLYGTLGATYYVEYSESLPASSWNSLTNLVMPTTVCTIVDTSASGSEQRFYRAFGVQSQ